VEVHVGDVVPDEIARLIKRSPTAWANLLAQAPSYRKQWVTWLENAKRPETREKRAKDTIARLERNEKPGSTISVIAGRNNFRECHIRS
jgi:uncharacterized protein YdeI (YjbR/CyaY-like superfamily)